MSLSYAGCVFLPDADMSPLFLQSRPNRVTHSLSLKNLSGELVPVGGCLHDEVD